MQTDASLGSLIEQISWRVKLIEKHIPPHIEMARFAND